MVLIDFYFDEFLYYFRPHDHHKSSCRNYVSLQLVFDCVASAPTAAQIFAKLSSQLGEDSWRELLSSTTSIISFLTLSCSLRVAIKFPFLLCFFYFVASWKSAEQRRNNLFMLIIYSYVPLQRFYFSSISHRFLIPFQFPKRANKNIIMGIRMDFFLLDFFR